MVTRVCTGLLEGLSWFGFPGSNPEARALVQVICVGGDPRLPSKKGREGGGAAGGEVGTCGLWGACGGRLASSTAVAGLGVVASRAHPLRERAAPGEVSVPTLPT